MTKNNPNLTHQQNKVLFEEATEPPGSSELNFEKREGSYHCANCGVKLFESETKYESGSGWPSFSSPYSSEVMTEHRDDSYGMIRTEVKCRKCNAHLGHVFEDGPEPTGLRYCINGVAIDGKK